MASSSSSQQIIKIDPDGDLILRIGSRLGVGGYQESDHEATETDSEVSEAFNHESALKASSSAGGHKVRTNLSDQEMFEVLFYSDHQDRESTAPTVLLVARQRLRELRHTTLKKMLIPRRLQFSFELPARSLLSAHLCSKLC